MRSMVPPGSDGHTIISACCARLKALDAIRKPTAAFSSPRFSRIVVRPCNVQSASVWFLSPPVLRHGIT